jgi:SprT protein
VSSSERIVQFSETLRPFLPSGTEYYVAEFLIGNVVHFTISKKRSTKLGDYRQAHDGKPHRISVNGDLNKYAFLVTTIHEMAHLTTFDNYGNRVRSHGKEWKAEFAGLFQPLIERDLLPGDVTQAVSNYLKNAKAASCSDERLYRVLRRYNKNKGVLVEHLEMGAIFELGGRTFELGQKLRKRYECKELKNGKTYRVLGLAEIDKEIEDEQ